MLPVNLIVRGIFETGVIFRQSGHCFCSFHPSHSSVPHTGAMLKEFEAPSDGGAARLIPVLRG